MTGDPTIFYVICAAVLAFMFGVAVGQERKPKKK